MEPMRSTLAGSFTDSVLRSPPASSRLPPSRTSSGAIAPADPSSDGLLSVTSSLVESVMGPSIPVRSSMSPAGPATGGEGPMLPLPASRSRGPPAQQRDVHLGRREGPVPGHEAQLARIGRVEKGGRGERHQDDVAEAPRHLRRGHAAEPPV